MATAADGTDSPLIVAAADPVIDDEDLASALGLSDEDEQEEEEDEQEEHQLNDDEEEAEEFSPEPLSDFEHAQQQQLEGQAPRQTRCLSSRSREVAIEAAITSPLRPGANGGNVLRNGSPPLSAAYPGRAEKSAAVSAAQAAISARQRRHSLCTLGMTPEAFVAMSADMAAAAVNQPLPAVPEKTSKPGAPRLPQQPTGSNLAWARGLGNQPASGAASNAGDTTTRTEHSLVSLSRSPGVFSTASAPTTAPSVCSTTTPTTSESYGNETIHSNSSLPTSFAGGGLVQSGGGGFHFPSSASNCSGPNGLPGSASMTEGERAGGSSRPGTMLGYDNGARYLPWSDLAPLPSEPTPATFQIILQRLQANPNGEEWLTPFNTLSDVRRIALNHPGCLTQPVQTVHAKRTGVTHSFGSHLVNAVVNLADSLRSNVAKNAMLALHDLYFFADAYLTDGNSIELATSLCLKKTAGAAGTAFLTEEAERALKQCLMVGDEHKLFALLAKTLRAPSGVNAKLKARCVSSVGMVVARLSAAQLARITAHKEFPGLLKIIVKASGEGSADLRGAAKTSIYVLANCIPDLEIKMRTSMSEVDLAQLRSVVRRLGEVDVSAYYGVPVLCEAFSSIPEVIYTSLSTSTSMSLLLDNIEEFREGAAQAISEAAAPAGKSSITNRATLARMTSVPTTQRTALSRLGGTPAVPAVANRAAAAPPTTAVGAPAATRAITPSATRYPGTAASQARPGSVVQRPLMSATGKVGGAVQYPRIAGMSRTVERSPEVSIGEDCGSGPMRTPPSVPLRQFNPGSISPCGASMSRLACRSVLPQRPKASALQETRAESVARMAGGYDAAEFGGRLASGRPAVQTVGNMGAAGRLPFSRAGGSLRRTAEAIEEVEDPRRTDQWEGEEEVPLAAAARLPQPAARRMPVAALSAARIGFSPLLEEDGQTDEESGYTVNVSGNNNNGSGPGFMRGGAELLGTSPMSRLVNRQAAAATPARVRDLSSALSGVPATGYQAAAPVGEAPLVGGNSLVQKRINTSTIRSAALTRQRVDGKEG